jgi:YesN/AraC family two-component response regulator
MKRITVLLADGNKVVRRGFREILEFEDDLEVVGEAKNGLQAVAMVKKLRPALVLMDIAMPLLNWFTRHPPDSQSRPRDKSAHAFGSQ